jgi:hypothetical protein
MALLFHRSDILAYHKFSILVILSYLESRSGFKTIDQVSRLNARLHVLIFTHYRVHQSPAKWDYISDLNKLRYASRRRPIGKVVVLSIHWECEHLSEVCAAP